MSRQGSALAPEAELLGMALDVELGHAHLQPLLRIGDGLVVELGPISATKKFSSAAAWMLPIGSSAFSLNQRSIEPMAWARTSLRQFDLHRTGLPLDLQWQPLPAATPWTARVVQSGTVRGTGAADRAAASAARRAAGLRPAAASVRPPAPPSGAAAMRSCAPPKRRVLRKADADHVPAIRSVRAKGAAGSGARYSTRGETRHAPPPARSRKVCNPAQRPMPARSSTSGVTSAGGMKGCSTVTCAGTPRAVDGSKRARQAGYQRLGLRHGDGAGARPWPRPWPGPELRSLAACLRIQHASACSGTARARGHFPHA